MSFSLPWSINKLVSTNINNANSVTGTYTNVSLKVNGKTELSDDTTISRLGVGKNTNSSYVIDASGNMNISGDYYKNGTIFSPTGLLTSNNSWSGTNFFTNTTTAPTVSSSDNSTNVSTTAFVKNQNYTTLSAVQSNNNTFSGTNTFSKINMTNGFNIQQALVVTDNFYSTSFSLIMNFNYYDTIVVIPSSSRIVSPPLVNITLPQITTASIGAKVRIMLGGPLVGGDYSYEIQISNYPSTQQIFYNGTKYIVLPIDVGNGFYNGYPVGYELVAVNTSQAWAVTNVTWSPNIMTQNNNNWSGTNAFSSLPTSTQTPTTSTQLITKTYADTTYGRISSTNNWSGTNTFNSSLPTSSQTPTTSTQLITKAYGDATYQATGSYGTISGTNNWSGTNTFNSSLPTSSQTPTTSTQLITKAYGDATYQATGSYGTISGTNNWSGTNTFNSSLPTSSQTPTTSTQLITKAYGDSTYGLLGSTNTWGSTQTFSVPPVLTNKVTLQTASVSGSSFFVYTVGWGNNENIIFTPEAAYSGILDVQLPSIATANIGTSFNILQGGAGVSTSNYVRIRNYNATAGLFYNGGFSTNIYIDMGRGIYLTSHFGYRFTAISTSQFWVVQPIAFNPYSITNSANTWATTNDFSVLPTSSLTPTQASTTATQFLTRQINDARYGQILSSVTNTWSSTQIFSILPTSTDTTTTPVNNSLIRKQYADTRYNLLGQYTNTEITNQIVNSWFQLPLITGTNVAYYLVSSSTTDYAPNSSTLTALGFTGWGFQHSGTQQYSAAIQSGTGGTYFLTGYPYSYNQCLVLAINGAGSSVKLYSATYTGYGAGVYNLGFWLCGGGFYYNSYIVANVYSSGTLVFTSPKINVQGSFPTWQYLTYDLTLATNTGVYVSFDFYQDPTNSAGYYACIMGVILTGHNGFIFSDSTGTSVIAGTNSLLNSLSVNNGFAINSGGISSIGQVNFNTTYGLNNIAISNSLGDVVGSNNTNCVSIGSGSLGAATGANNCTIVGGQINGLTNTTNPSDLVVIGSNCQTLNQSQSVFIGSTIQSPASTGGNNVIGYNIGGGQSGLGGDYNSILGNNGFSRYNGFNLLTPSYNCAIGHNSQTQSADYYNVSLGANSLQLMAGVNGVTGGGNSGYTTQYNCAIGHNSGKTYTLLNKCTLLGAATDLGSNNLTNATAIGYATIVSASDTIQLGSHSETVAISGSLKSGSNTITAAQLGYLSAVSTGIVDTNSAQTIAGVKTFSSAPVMSGASITSGTVGQTQVSNGYVDLGTDQTTIGGNKTFLSSVTVNQNLKTTQGYANGLSPTMLSTSSSILSSSTYYQIYNFSMTSAAALTMTLSSAATYPSGTEITFKRIGGSLQILNIQTAQIGTSGFYQPLFLLGSTQGTLGSSGLNALISASLNTSKIYAFALAGASGGTLSATYTSGATSISLSAPTSAVLYIGTVITISGNVRQITAYGTGLGGAGTYTINASIASTFASGTAYTTQALSAWGQTYIA